MCIGFVLFWPWFFTWVSTLLISKIFVFPVMYIKFDPFCLHWSCSPSNGRGVTSQMGATPMHSKWIKLDLAVLVENSECFFLLIWYTHHQPPFFINTKTLMKLKACRLKLHPIELAALPPVKIWTTSDLRQQYSCFHWKTYTCIKEISAQVPFSYLKNHSQSHLLCKCVLCFCHIAPVPLYNYS